MLPTRHNDSLLSRCSAALTITTAPSTSRQGGNDDTMDAMNAGDHMSAGTVDGFGDSDDESLSSENDAKKPAAKDAPDAGEKQSTLHSDDDSSVELIASTEDPEQQTPMYKLLLSRKPEAKKLADRRNLLEGILKKGDLKKLFDARLCGPVSKIAQHFENLTATSSAAAAKTKHWNSNCVATCLIDFWEAIQENDELLKTARKMRSQSKNKSNKEESNAIANIRTFVAAAEKRIAQDTQQENAVQGMKAMNNRAGGRTEKHKKGGGGGRKRKLGTQKGPPIQDTLVWDPDLREQYECPGCSHFMLMRVDPQGNEKADANNKSKSKKLRSDVRTYNNTSQKDRGSKPKLTGGTDSAQLACMCCVNHCRLRMDGHGCVTCQEFARIGQRPHVSV